MAKEICTSCAVKLPGRVSFCPSCSRPTAFATEAELVEWDLQQWRSHVDRAVATGAGTVAPMTLSSVAVTSDPRPDPKLDLQVIVRPDEPPVSDPEPTARRPRRSARLPQHPRRAERRERLADARLERQPEADRVIVLDADSSFLYTACTCCERSDWIVRTTRNEDDSYNYWCVRCSRSFKTDARLRHAWKPFVSGGSVVAALATLSILMR